jgi:hypothetical protein
VADTKTKGQLWIVVALAGAAAIFFVVWRVAGVSAPAPKGLAADEKIEAQASEPALPDLQPQEPTKPVPVEVSGSPSVAPSAPKPGPTVRLYGALLDARDRTPVTYACSVRVIDEDWAERTLTTGTDGGYSFTDLHPGAWEITVREPSLQTMRTRVELREEEPEKRLDLFLHLAVVVKVRVEGAAGEDLKMASGSRYLAITGIRQDLSREARTLEERLRARGFPNRLDLTIVATRTEPGRWFRDETTSEARVGSFIDRNAIVWGPEMERAAKAGAKQFELSGALLRDGTRLDELPPAYCGVIQLSEPPPAFASLVVRDYVLRTVPIPPAVDEIVFTITRDELKRLPGQVKVTVTDAEQAGPPPGAQVRIDEPLPREVVPSLDEKGSITFENILPGWATLTITAPEREVIIERFLVQPGVLTDLATYRMQPFSEIRARVLDEEGAPARVQFNVFPLDRYEPAREPLASRIFRSSADGDLKVDSIGRGRYLLLAHDDNWTAAPVIADTTFRQTDRIEIRVSKGTDVWLRLRGDPPPGALLSIQTSTGLPVTDTNCRDGETIRLRLAPGSYSAALRDGDTWLWSEGFSVGTEPLRRYFPR